jgi:hypothetical protein
MDLDLQVQEFFGWIEQHLRDLSSTMSNSKSDELKCIKNNLIKVSTKSVVTPFLQEVLSVILESDVDGFGILSNLLNILNQS